MYYDYASQQCHAEAIRIAREISQDINKVIDTQLNSLNTVSSSKSIKDTAIRKLR